MSAVGDASVLVLLGSARGDGNTAAAVERLRGRLGERATVIDLSSLAIAPFSYNRHDNRDDFRSVVRLWGEAGPPES